jgi:hypothetical protein
MFDAAELAFVQAVAPHLAGGIRSLLVGEAVDPGPDAPGLVVPPTPGRSSRQPGVERWIQELPDGDWDRQAAVGSAGGRGPGATHRRAPGRAGGGRGLAGAVALGHLGGAHGASLVWRAHRVAVIAEPAHPGASPCC